MSFIVSNLLNLVMETQERRTEELETQFLLAAEQMNLKEVLKCIKLGVNPNCIKLENGQGALHTAADRDDLSLTQMLLDCPNTIVDIRSYYGTTPLHKACASGNVSIAECLLQKGADPNKRSHFDRTALHLAVLHGNMKTVKLLFKYGVTPNVFDAVGNSPLHLALLMSKSLPMVKMLVRYGVNPNIHEGHMPLFLECVFACHTEKQKEVTMYLLKQGVNINITDKVSDRNALHYVAQTGYLPLAVALLKSNCDPFKEDHYGKTPFDVAENHEHVDMAFLLMCSMETERLPSELDAEAEKD